MNREALDAFFAEAEDVLTDWHGSPDSMNTSGTAQRRGYRSVFRELVERHGATIQIGSTVYTLPCGHRIEVGG
jgi:hypothetical protein